MGTKIFIKFITVSTWLYAIQVHDYIISTITEIHLCYVKILPRRIFNFAKRAYVDSSHITEIVARKEVMLIKSTRP